MYEVFRYQTADGHEPLTEWLQSLRDTQTKARILSRLDRLETGNLGDIKLLREGVSEIRIDCGPGYRVYFGMASKTVVLLLSGGDKRKQDADIRRAIKYWQDFKRRQK